MPEIKGSQLSAFFAQLTWPKLERRMLEALKDPKKQVPTRMSCPAVMDLARDVVNKIGETAITKFGEPVSDQERFSYDQRVGVMRLLEAIICEAEDWLSRGSEPQDVTAIPHSPMLGIIHKRDTDE